MIRRPPRSTLFPSRRSSDLCVGSSCHSADPNPNGRLTVTFFSFAGSPLPIVFLHFISLDRKSTRLNSSHANISYAVFCLNKKTIRPHLPPSLSPTPNVHLDP